MTCILAKTERNSRNKFQRKYRQNQTTFFRSFIEFMESRENFQYFEKKGDLDHFNISRVIDSKTCGSLNSRKLLFQNPFWR